MRVDAVIRGVTPRAIGMRVYYGGVHLYGFSFFRALVVFSSSFLSVNARRRAFVLIVEQWEVRLSF